MSGEFRVSHYKYTQALNNIETYLNYSGNVLIENETFIPKTVSLSEKVWNLLYSFFSSERRQANMRITAAKAELLARCLTEINMTHNKLKSYVNPNSTVEAELNLSGIFYNVCLSVIKDWNRYNSPSNFGYLARRITCWLGFSPSRLDNIVSVNQSGFSRISIPTALDPAFYDEVEKARKTRFLSGVLRMSGFYPFSVRKNQNFWEVAVFINTMKLANFQQCSIAQIMKPIEADVTRAGGDESKKLVYNQLLSLYFPEFLDGTAEKAELRDRISFLQRVMPHAMARAAAAIPLMDNLATQAEMLGIPGLVNRGNLQTFKEFTSGR